jgi:hypothetical protein
MPLQASKLSSTCLLGYSTESFLLHITSVCLPTTLSSCSYSRLPWFCCLPDLVYPVKDPQVKYLNSINVRIKTAKLNEKLSLCLTNYHVMKSIHYLIKHYVMNTYWVSGFRAPSFIILGSSWRWVVKFTSRSLYTLAKNLRHPLDMRFDGLQIWSRRGGEEKESVLCLEFTPVGEP